jgi:hypothetical protein
MNMNMDAMITKAMEKGMRTMLRAYGEMLVNELSEKYKFSMEEGMGYLEGSKMEMVKGKVKSKESKESKENKVKEKEIPLPYMGMVKEEWCAGMRKTHGLYNQCRNEKVAGEGSEYCGRCEKESKITGTGEPRGGRIEKRDEVDEKKITHYSVVMKKLGLTKERVESEAAKYGWVVDESEFEKQKSKRGRKKNENEKETEKENEGKEKEKKQRGRPKKEKRVVSCDVEEVDLIGRMVKEAEMLKECEEYEMEEKKNVKEEENKKAYELESEEEGIEVYKFEFEGKTYCKTKENVVYDPETSEEVGMWNEEEEKIEYFEEEEEEE